MNKIEIDKSDLKKEITIEGEIYLLTPKKQLQNLLDQNKSYKNDIDVLRAAVIAVLNLLGLLDENTGQIKEEIKSGSYVKHIIKSLKNVMFMMVDTKEAIAEKFSFIKPVLPILAKYVNDPAATPLKIEK